MLLADTDGPGALTTLERLRAAQLPGDLTFSAGAVVLAPDDDVAPEELVLRADRALQLAKRSGRDQIRLWRPGLDEESDPDPVPQPRQDGARPRQGSRAGTSEGPSADAWQHRAGSVPSASAGWLRARPASWIPDRPHDGAWDDHPSAR